MPRKWFLIILAIVIIPVSGVCLKIVQYAHESKTQVFELHQHIVHGLSLNTATYFQQLNLRLAFAPLLARTGQWGEILSILNNALMSNSDFGCVALLDNSGREKAKAFDAGLTDLKKTLDYSANDLFLRIREKRQADLGAVYEKNRQSFFDVLYPLENGQWLLVSVRWESLKKMLFDQQVGKFGYIWLVDETGRVVADSRSEHVGMVLLPRWKFFRDRLADKDPWEGEFADHDGHPSVGAGQWVTGAGWFILSAQPQSEAYATMWQLRRRAFIWMFISIIGMGMFAYFWVRHISFPITRLAVGVQSVVRHNFDEKIPENFSLEEFRALSRAFNQMMGELRAYNELQVEKIIDEKTKVTALLFSIQDGIVMLSDHGELMFANDPAKQWTVDVAGRGKDSFDKTWQSLQEYPPWMDLLEPVLQSKKASASEEFEFPVKGRSRWARVLAQQVLTESGRRLGIMVVIHDVTQDKEVDRMKEDFFNGITHDLRTPLAATIGYLGLSEMQLPAGTSELSTLVGSARQSAKRALSLVETILSLARLQAGKLAMNPAPIQVQAMLKRVAGDLSFQAMAKKITLSAECPDENLWICADQGLLERVIENLTGNAIKYTMEKGWVKLWARAVPEGVEISVQDNGRGIPPDALKSLFGKFQQVKAEDRSVGFGIGLSFSKGIVEAHGSAIQIESEVGKGSRFFFVLGRAQAPAQQKAA